MNAPPPLSDNSTRPTVDNIVPAPQAPEDTVLAAVELEIRQSESAKLRLTNQEFGEIIKQRGEWGTRVFWMLLGWLLSVVFVILFQGFHFWGFHLDNSVVIAFIGTTTADVLGLGYVVANFLFPKPK